MSLLRLVINYFMLLKICYYFIYLYCYIPLFPNFRICWTAVEEESVDISGGKNFLYIKNPSYHLN